MAKGLSSLGINKMATLSPLAAPRRQASRGHAARLLAPAQAATVALASGFLNVMTLPW